MKHTTFKGYICADIYSPDLKDLNEGNICYLRSYKGDEHIENLDTGTYFVMEKGLTIQEQMAVSNVGPQLGDITKYTFNNKETMYRYRLRHLNSGRYIKMVEIDIIFKNKKKADKQERILGLSKLFEKPDDKENSETKEFDDHTVFQF